MGGAEMQVFLLAKTLQSRGWRVGVVSMIRPLYFVNELAACGVDVFSLDMKPGVASPAALLRLAKIYRDWRPQLVHSHMYHANILARFMRIFFPSIRLVSSAHNNDETNGSHLRYWLYRATRFASSFMTNVGQATFDNYVKLGLIVANKGAPVYNGIDTAQLQPSPQERHATRMQLGLQPDAFVWCAAGRFVEQKDYPNLLAALLLLKRLSPLPFKVLLVGDGHLRPRIHQMVDEYALSDVVEFLGIRTDLPAIFNAVDGFVMSSKHEGFPLALLEAMAIQKICVATDVGAVSEALALVSKDLLVAPSDPTNLAGAMHKVMQLLPPERRRLELLSRSTIEAHFDIHAIAAQWETIYRPLIRANTR
jgi:glycosyltransferase involved in cell wall biosynthesis